ncbi:MAG: GGDEF domain-containing protein [Patescibacteria group bacterium]
MNDTGTEQPKSGIGIPIEQIVATARKGEPDRAQFHFDRIKQALREKPLDQVAEALGQEFANLEEQRDEDPATGLKTRISGIKILDQQIALATRMGHSLSVIMLDLDGFKQVNDTQGHEAGNQVIKMWADFLNHETSREAVACRYGGDEFFVIMPGSTIDEATGLAKRISTELQPKMLESGFKVTASIGLSTLTGDETPDELLARADRGVLDAKENGKDRIVVSKT